MMEIGIDRQIIENYYKGIEKLEYVKYHILNDVNEDEEIVKKGEKVMNQLSKKDREEVAELNAIMGTGYREVGYNLENPKDLIEAVENVTAEYMDYQNYWFQLAHIEENFDQSLEVFHPEKWFKIVKQGNTGDELFDNAMFSIHEAANNMFELVKQSEQKCRELWKILLLSDKQEAIGYFIGQDTEYTKEEILEVIDGVIENIYDVNYHNQIQEDAQSFAKAIKRVLEESKEVVK